MLQKHRRDYLYLDDSKEFRVTVRRNDNWKDAIRAMKRKFDEKQHISIIFLGESAIDDGGPKREFFTLVLKPIKENNSRMDGPLYARVLRHNTTSLQENQYLYIGKLMALSIVHGGPSPSFFSECVVDYIFSGMAAVVPSIDDIPDFSIRQQVEMVYIFMYDY